MQDVEADVVILLLFPNRVWRLLRDTLAVKNLWNGSGSGKKEGGRERETMSFLTSKIYIEIWPKAKAFCASVSILLVCCYSFFS